MVSRGAAGPVDALPGPAAIRDPHSVDDDARGRNRKENEGGDRRERAHRRGERPQAGQCATPVQRDKGKAEGGEAAIAAADLIVVEGGPAALRSRGRDPAALRRLNAKIHADKRVDMALATIGDGLTLVRKK